MEGTIWHRCVTIQQGICRCPSYSSVQRLTFEFVFFLIFGVKDECKNQRMHEVISNLVFTILKFRAKNPFSKAAKENKYFLFLDAFSHLYKRVCPSVRPSVRWSVGPSVTHELNFWEMGEIEQNSIRNKKVCHLKDDSKTSTRAVRQRTHLLSELYSTCLLDAQYNQFHSFPNNKKKKITQVIAKMSSLSSSSVLSSFCFFLIVVPLLSFFLSPSSSVVLSSPPSPKGRALISGHLAILSRLSPDGLVTANLTDGEAVMSFQLDPFPQDGNGAGVKDCQLVRTVGQNRKKNIE